MTKRELASQFEGIVRRLLAREQFEPNVADLSLMFELVATSLLGSRASRRGQYFDGVDGLVVRPQGPDKVEFSGKMWVGIGKAQGQEDFRAIVWGTSPAAAGLRIAIQVGNDRGEAELYAAFNAEPEPDATT